MERKIIGFHEIERSGRGRDQGAASLSILPLFGGGWGRGCLDPRGIESNGIDRAEKGGRGGMATMPERGPTTLFSPVIVSVRLRFMRNLLPTSRRASLGHSWNQSMVVQLIRAGYWRNLFLNASPIGLRHRIRCILVRALSINSA